MRPRTFAREIAFQVLYREDLNPTPPPDKQTVSKDPLLEQGVQTQELMSFVRHLAELSDQVDALAPDEGELFSQWLRTPALVEFTRLLVQGVTTHRAVLDEKIAAAAENWTIERMAATDRNLLRLGAYELHLTETPAKVAVDEAVELAKLFGGAQSAQFVNGILDKLMHQEKDLRPKT